METILYLNATGEISGAERSLLAMLDALDRDRWTPVVAAPTGPLLREAAARGVRVEAVELMPLRRSSSLDALWRTFSALQGGWRQVNELIERVRPAVVHANATPAMVYLVRVRGVRAVWHVRDLTPLGMVGGLLYQRAHRVAVISSAVREEIARIAPDAAKCALLPPAVDTTHFRPCEDKAALRAALGLPADVPLIGMIAQFVRWKRHHLFLDALCELHGHAWHAVLAGADLHQDEAYVKSLQDRLAEPPLAGRVSLLPWQDDAASLLAALDICALTSEREPFGRVLIESAACGVPAVAMDDAGPRDIILPGETGLLCVDDPLAIAAHLARLLDDPALRARLGTAARARAEAHFSLAQHGAALTRLYEGALSAVP